MGVLNAALGGLVGVIHYIGSVSVLGLMAKPIIDIFMMVDSLADLDFRSGAMNDVGYEVKGEFGIEGRRYFPKREA